jgi:hypothetical protein
MSDDKEPRKKIEFRKPKEESQSKRFDFRANTQKTEDKKPTFSNVAPKPKPQNVRTNAPSPTGTISVGGRRDVNITVTNEEIPSQEIAVPLDRNDVNLEYQDKGFNVLLRVDDNKSDRGVDGGRISRLTLTEGEIGNEKIHAHFESGKWEQDPSTFVENQIIDDAKKQNNGLTAEDLKQEYTEANRHRIKP